MVNTVQRDLLSAAIRKMFEAQAELNRVFPKRPFTPDGRMIGDIGEAIAEIDYLVTVDPKSRKDWDGRREGVCEGCPEVQVRATQRDDDDNIYVKESPDNGWLLVFRLFQDGHWECRYNGRTSRVWEALKNKKADKDGWKGITLVRLRELDREVANDERIASRENTEGVASLAVSA